VISADQTSGYAPLTVHFSGLGSSDPDPGDTLTYAWDLDNDGEFDDSISPAPTYTFTSTGDHIVRLQVSDNRGASSTASVLISVEQPDESSGQDGFGRADGGLGPDWLQDPWWGGGLAISGGEVTSAPGTGGGSYWNADTFGADQYSQIRITGVPGDWTGVMVRGSVSPSQCYVVAVKPDGAYLYSFVGGAFYQLAHDATGWATGDVLRLEVRTVAAGTARLMVYRNGSQLLVHDDAEHFLDGGQPGIGLHASTLIALDDWAGGDLASNP
jgi:PKD repeat protein